jgi:hypothetical protein
VWLASRIARAIPDRRRELVETVSFAQRVLPETDGEEPEVLRALSGFRRFPMLALTLERIGIRSASLHARFVGVASQLADIDSAEAARQRLSLLQASLALVERLMFRGALQVATAEGLLSTLATRLEVGASTDPSVVGAWIAGDLLPQLGAAPPGDSPREALLLRALAGRPERSDDVQVEWEGTRYRVAANEMRFERLRNVRRRQENSLDAALDGVAAATPESGGQLAESLVSLAYAAALAESADWLPDARDLHLRHDYSSGTSGTDRSHPSWALGVEVSGPDVRWHIQGSLLGLDLVLAPLRLRRISSEPPHQAPRLNENDRRTFVQSLALLNPGRLTDADRDTLARSLARGRARVGTLVSRTADLAGAAADAGLSAWRFRAAEWTLQHEPDRLMDLWSMRELLALGDPNTRGRFDEWGLSAFPVDGSLRPRLCDPEPWEHIAGRPMTGRLAAFVPDLHLRMAETLAIRDLPASLAPAALAGAVQSLIDEAQPAYMDDWQSLIAYVRNLPPARFDDYLSLLTAGGPLVPEAAADGASHEARTGSR